MIICLLLSISSLKAQNPDYNTILSEIDADIKIADGYDRARNTRINDLKGSLMFYPSDSARYYTHRALYEEFKEISNDSALVHIEKAIEIADKLGRKDLRASALASMAMQCAIAGLYYESRMMLNDVDTSLLDNTSLIIYYRARWKTYRDLAQYTYVESLRVQYEGWANAAIDSIVARAPKNSDFYYRFMGEKLLDAGNFNEALDLSNHWLSMIAGDTRRLASAMYERHKIFKSLNQHEDMKLSLALSGLYDLRNGIKDQFSLFTLARYLKDDGDT